MTRKFRNSLSGCESCRIEWYKGRVSRLFPWWAFGLAATATWVSGVDVGWKVFLTLAWLFEAVRAGQAASGFHAGTVQVDWDADGMHVRVQGAPVSAFNASRRGKCLLMHWRDRGGRRRAVCLWPGEVSSTALRELRRALAAPVDATHTPLLST